MKSTKSSAQHQMGTLAQVPTDDIVPNPDNPRLTFQQGELDELQESIRRYGVQVPIAVFRQGGRFVLIDGERRWRCASKLNMKVIPALVQEEPDPLQNLLLMFNIHALREQWDMLTIALKLPKIIDLLKAETGSEPGEAALAERTGLARGMIRRCRLLTDLPKRYQDILLQELPKPKSKRQVGEDFFIEMEKALKTVTRAMPSAIRDIDKTRDALLRKYRAGTIKSNIEFRKVSKIARAGTVKADQKSAQRALVRLIDEPTYSIDDAWEDTVSGAYAERDLVTRIDGLIARLDRLGPSDVDADLRRRLELLVRRATALIGRSR